MVLRNLWCAILVLTFAGLSPAQGPLVPGQHDTDNRYEAIHTGAAAGETITIQQPANPSLSIQFELAVVYCASACTIKITQNGTGATATSLATTPLNGAPISTATAWSASNVSGGTSLYTYNLTAAGTLTLDLTKFILGKGAGINQNLSLTIGAGSSPTPQTMIQWIER
jgi:hypothetical protein